MGENNHFITSVPSLRMVQSLADLETVLKNVLRQAITLL